ncbi:MAG: hypothetical protein QG635_1938 [Bacteroidota bacterium]|nr:hypothetical protein [Bacteroidota bacterium]
MKTKSSFLLFIIIGLLIPFSILKSEDSDVKNLPRLLGMTNEGRDFYLTFHPCWDNLIEGNVKKIYITSRMKTKVTLEIPGKGIVKTAYTIPYDVIEFEITPTDAHCYRKSIEEPAKPDSIFRGYAIHIYSDDPIICVASGLGQNTGEGFLVFPVPALGKEYIVSSWEDQSNDVDSFLPGYVSVAAPYDNTRVRIILGGNEATETAGGIKSGETKSWTIHQGDVLLIATKGKNSDLSGSRIMSSKPVAVISGHYHANIPTENPTPNYLIEQELPMHLWNKEYHIANFLDRKYNSWLKIYAKEPNTSIFRDGQFIGKIDSVGGVEGSGFLSMRAYEGTPHPIVITSDKPIGITQYNTGFGEDKVNWLPFQMGLIPTELYQKEVTFYPLGLRGGYYDRDYINLIYQATDDGRIPDDLMFAEVQSGELVWRQISKIESEPGVEFSVLANNKRYFSKTMLITEGFHKIKANAPFAAYLYGNWPFYSYGYPACLALSNYSKKDTVPPAVSFLYDSSGAVGILSKAKVRDLPEDAESRSNLCDIYFNKDSSYNFSFSHGDFMPGEDQETTWRLVRIDWSEDAKAVITFTDCAGNSTILRTEYCAKKFAVEPKELDLGKMKAGVEKDIKFWYKNSSTRINAIIDTLYMRANRYGYSKGFEIHGIEFPKTVPLQDSVPFYIRFTAKELGIYKDTICGGDSTSIFYLSTVTAEVEAAGINPCIMASDIDFGNIYAELDESKKVSVKNVGESPLFVEGFRGLFSGAFSLPNGIQLPIYLSKEEKYEFDVKFSPMKPQYYRDSIIFSSNSVGCDSIVILEGYGKTLSVNNNNEDIISISPNPADDWLSISLNNKEINGGCFVKLYDMLGNVAMEKNVVHETDNGWFVLNTTQLGNGIYFLKINTSEHVIIRKISIVH